MKSMNINKIEIRKILIILAVLLLIHAGLVMFFGTHKEGFHEDEYFTYWSAAGNSSIHPSAPVSWTSGPSLLLRYTVRSDNRFNFEAVKYNQMMDVHPPLYYLAMNVILSLRPETFTKWYGIALNGMCSAVSLIGIFLLFYRNGTKHRLLNASVIAFIYAISPSVISCDMFIRMYSMSVMWNVLYALVLSEAIRCPLEKRGRFAVLSVMGAFICYLAFLTHYFSLIVPFFLTFGFVLYSLVMRKGIIRMLLYGISCVAAIGLAILTFPTSLSHIFHGYRGQQAFSGLKNELLSDRIRIFYPVLNKDFLAGMFIPFIILALAGIIVFLVKNRDVASKWFITILFVSTGISSIFFMKSALVLGDSSCRYFYTALLIWIPTASFLILGIGSTLCKDKRFEIIITGVLCAAVLIPNVMVYAQGKVLFLFSEEKEAIAFSEKYSDYPLIVAYPENASYMLEYTIDQFWPYKNVLFVEGSHLMDDWQEITVVNSEKLVIYMDAPEEYAQHFVDCSNCLEKYTLIRHDPFYYVYLLE